jgi:hypothetical protein
MKQFMNHEMQEHRFASADKIAVMRRTFEEAIQCAWVVFGTKAFRRYSRGDERDPDGKWEARSKINVALWDTILYIFAYYERRQIVPIADAIREEFLDLLASDDIFIDSIGRTTDTPDRVRYRAETWKRRVDGLINAPANETRAFSSALKQRFYDDDPSCAICRQHVQSLDDAEIDHVVHYWRGGRTIPENARLTHRYCNRRRGGRA